MMTLLRPVVAPRMGLGGTPCAQAPRPDLAVGIDGAQDRTANTESRGLA